MNGHSNAANNEPRINDRIRAREVRLVGADGDQIGIKPLPEALNIARELELDLVEVADKANPPVCRIMDYGKYKYEAAQKAKESAQEATNVVVKEMKYRPKIGAGDFDTKTRKVEQFLGEGHKVKVTIMFRGREVAHPELGRKILDQVAEDVVHVGRVEIFPQLDGRNMTMVLRRTRRPRPPSREAAPAEGRGRREQPTAGRPSPPPDARPRAARAATRREHRRASLSGRVADTTRSRRGPAARSGPTEPREPNAQDEDPQRRQAKRFKVTGAGEADARGPAPQPEHEAVERPSRALPAGSGRRRGPCIDPGDARATDSSAMPGRQACKPRRS